VTCSPSCTTTPSLVSLTSRFQFTKSRVAEERQICGSTMSAVELSGRSDHWRGLLDASVRCPTPTHRLPSRGEPRNVSTPSCYSRSVLTFEQSAWMLSSHDRVASGGPSVSCLVAAEHLRRPTLSHQHCIVFSTTRSRAFVRPLLAPTYRRL